MSLKLKKTTKILEPQDSDGNIAEPQSPKKLNKRRFASPVKSLDSYLRGFVPKNTEVSTQWAINNFDQWRVDYNSRHPEYPCPDGILLSDSSSDLSFWLQKYILRTRKKNGEQYPPKTLHLLLCGLNRFMKEKKLDSFNIFDHDNSDFKLLYNTCDSYFRELREEGIGSHSKPTEPISREDEERMWSSSAISVSTPKGLLNAVFFLNGKILLYVVEMNIVHSNSLKFPETFLQKVKYAIYTLRTVPRIVLVASTS